MPAELAQSYIKKNEEVPKFLLPPNHKDHIPPHIVACLLLKLIKDSKSKVWF